MTSARLRTPTAPGDRLGKYELISRLAIGGMAEIYLARAAGIEGFEKLAVVKKILPQLAEQPDFVRMFLDEARLAATLNHPNVAQVFDIGVAGRSHFFAMEYIHGEDLRHVLSTLAREQKPMRLDCALAIISGVCGGLHYAHERIGADGKPLNIVHRDVSPSNVIVTYDGTIKLVDFGIAKAATRTAETRSGTLKGKISYMSPEQCRGESLDRRADVFSIGILLYELTTGERLFPGDNDFAVLSQIVHTDAPRPSERRPGYPAALEAVVMMALARDPDARFQTALEMQIALEDVARELRLSMSPVRLSAMMKDLFGEKLEAWHTARAEGVSFEQHVVGTVVRGGAKLLAELDESEVTPTFLAPATGSHSRSRSKSLLPMPGSLPEPPVAPLRDEPRHGSSAARLAFLVCFVGLIGAGGYIWYLKAQEPTGRTEAPPPPPTTATPPVPVVVPAVDTVDAAVAPEAAATDDAAIVLEPALETAEPAPVAEAPKPVKKRWRPRRPAKTPAPAASPPAPKPPADPDSPFEQ